MAQPPPPAEHGLTNNNTPGAGTGAPIGEGMFLLLGLTVLYGGKKVYDLRKQLKRVNGGLLNQNH